MAGCLFLLVFDLGRYHYEELEIVFWTIWTCGVEDCLNAHVGNYYLAEEFEERVRIYEKMEYINVHLGYAYCRRGGERRENVNIILQICKLQAHDPFA